MLGQLKRCQKSLSLVVNSKQYGNKNVMDSNLIMWKFKQNFALQKLFAVTKSFIMEGRHPFR